MFPRSTRNNSGGRAVVGQVTMPAPVGGLNAVDAYVQMPPQDALTLQNYIPRSSYVELRPGYALHVGALTAATETLAQYGGEVANKLFAAAGTAIYDVTNATSSVGAAVVTSLANAQFQSINFSAGGGDYLVMVNGADGVRTYNGTGWSNQSAAISSATASDFVGVASWKSRLWFVKEQDTKAYYLGAGAIAGSCSAVDIGAIWRMGGVLQAITAVSTDSGDGIDDHIAFISSKGEVAIYQGTDPDSANTFSLVGVYRIGRPLGYRCTYQFAGDALILTEDGVVSMLQMMRMDRSQEGMVALTRKIAPAFQDASRSQGSTWGWQAVTYPSLSLAIINVPDSSTVFRQYVMNTTSGAWCEFTGLNAYSWSLLGEDLYFGGAAGVYKFGRVYSDNGSAIDGAIKMAFSPLKAQRVKRFTAMRALLQSSGDPQARVGINVDYEDAEPTDIVSVSQTGAVWDTALWDEATWGGETSQINRYWQVIGDVGVVVAPRVSTQTTGLEVRLLGVDLMYEPASGPVFG